jgi:peptide/nickel transport system substrate-binding protein
MQKSTRRSAGGATRAARPLAVTMGLALLACGLGACASSNGPRAGAKPQLTIALESGNGTNSLNPQQASTGALYFLELAYEPLILATPAGKLQPGLATSWSLGANNEQLTLTLRQNVRFSNGQALTPSAVVNSFNYFLKGYNPYSGILNESGAKIAATGQHKVTVTTSKPLPVLPLLLSENYFAGDIVAPAGLAHPSQLATHTYGAGPYQLDASATVASSTYVYEPNPDYFDQSEIHFSKFTIKIISSETSELEALTSGQVNFMFGTSATVSAAKSANLSVLSSPDNQVQFYLFNHYPASQKALENPLVRQALNYAINRAQIATALFGQYGSGTDQPSVPGFDGYDPALANYYPYDPAKAKQLLARAGFASGLVIPVTYVSTIAPTADAVQAVAADWQKVGVTLKPVPASSLDGMFTNVAVSNKTVSSNCWESAFLGPQFIQVTSQWLPSAANPPYGISDTPSFVAEWNAAIQLPPSSQSAAMQSIEKTVVESAFTVPIAQYDSFAYVGSGVANVQYGPFGVDLYQWTSK